jgi:Ca2+-binding RTX toxin-like protein
VFIEGTSAADHLQGSDEDDVMTGGEGCDCLAAGGGADFVDGGADADDLSGGLGNDILLGGDGHDRLRGGYGNDRLDGGAGDDVLLGGAGYDRLTGGLGADAFCFSATAMRQGSVSSDVVVDFNGLEGDRIKLEGYARPLMVTSAFFVDGSARYLLNAGWGVFATVNVARGASFRSFGAAADIVWVPPFASSDFSDSIPAIPG